MSTVVIVLFGIAALFMCPMLIGAVLAFLFYGAILGVLYLLVPTTWFWGSIAVFALFALLGKIKENNVPDHVISPARQREMDELFGDPVSDVIAKLRAVKADYGTMGSTLPASTPRRRLPRFRF